MQGGLRRTLRLVELAFAAERVGNQHLADRLFAEAERIGPAALLTSPEDEERNVQERHRQPERMFKRRDAGCR